MVLATLEGSLRNTRTTVCLEPTLVLRCSGLVLAIIAVLGPSKLLDLTFGLGSLGLLLGLLPPLGLGARLGAIGRARAKRLRLP